MLKIALILAEKDVTYQDIASQFFEHFTQISDAINEMSSGLGLWDEQDGFYYDHLSAGTSSEALRISPEEQQQNNSIKLCITIIQG